MLSGDESGGGLMAGWRSWAIGGVVLLGLAVAWVVYEVVTINILAVR